MIDMEIIGRLLQIVEVDHVEVAYEGSNIYVGKGGWLCRLNPGASHKTNHAYSLSKRFPYRSDACILKCLKFRRSGASRNCQGDVKDAIRECGLTGFSTFVSSCFPNL